jgi:uncharacterized protein
MLIRTLLNYTRLIFLVFIFSCTPKQTEKADYPIKAVPFTAIELKDNFWSKRITTNREVTIPYGFKKCEEEGRIRNFARAGGLIDGKYEGLMPFDDTDVYKIIEGASYSLQTNPDNKLEKYIDDIIAKIAAAQEDDGYLTTWKTIDPDTTPAWWVKPGPRWFNLGSSHELYNAGHMYEAAYAHYRATGKKNFLNVALKNADLIAATFGPGKLLTPPGHQIIETGLVKLYRASGDKKYLDLAKFFLDERGDSLGHKLYGPYNQDHIPVINQEEAVGHAVRAVYMYAAMADIAALENDTKYLKAVNKIWQNVVTRKIYITGGLGARHEGESFGDNYELPNLTSYNETCAAIANVYWNQRMFLLSGDAKYIDVLERTLYNSLISGVSLEGDAFFYPNCLASDGKYAFNQGALTRKAWFDCSCCPSNIIRFLPSVPDYIYAQKQDTVFVNLYMSNQAQIKIANSDLVLEQQTGYPWDGKIILTVKAKDKTAFVLNLRIPGWATDKPLPGDLYSYIKHKNAAYTVKVNNQVVKTELNKGYAAIQRNWSDGDSIELMLPMNVQRVIANDHVKDDSAKIALERGPIVYCAEWIDNGGKVLDLVLPNQAQFETKYQDDLLGGIMTLKSNAMRSNGKSTAINVIPYYAWSHRGPGEMTVWLKCHTGKASQEL